MMSEGALPRWSGRRAVRERRAPCNAAAPTPPEMDTLWPATPATVPSSTSTTPLSLMLGASSFTMSLPVMPCLSFQNSGLYRNLTREREIVQNREVGRWETGDIFAQESVRCGSARGEGLAAGLALEQSAEQVGAGMPAWDGRSSVFGTPAASWSSEAPTS